MRAIVRQAWSDALDEAMKVSASDFALVSKKWSGEPKGVKKYVWEPTKGLKCFVAFRPLDSEGFDEFIGWTTQDKYPSGSTLSSPSKELFDFSRPSSVAWSLALVPRSGASYWNFWAPSEAAVRNPGLFGEEHASHFGKALSYPDARQLVDPKVRMAVDEFVSSGVPYLKRLVSSRSN